MVVDSAGAVLYHKADDEDIFTITLEKENLIEIRNKFPFLKDGDNFNITAPSISPKRGGNLED